MCKKMGNPLKGIAHFGSQKSELIDMFY